MTYKEYQTSHEFSKFETIRSFENASTNNIIMMDMANDEQEQLAKKSTECQVQKASKFHQKNERKKKEKEGI